MVVAVASNSGSSDSLLGSLCCTHTIAVPGSSPRDIKNVLNASNPPAEPPTAVTIGSELDVIVAMFLASAGIRLTVLGRLYCRERFVETNQVRGRPHRPTSVH